MRLLNVETLQLESFWVSNDPDSEEIPRYAILSHTWSKEEIMFQELNDPASKNKIGYKKMEALCRLAAADGLSYAWMDTCCIDKKSSEELSESINSMFRWYQEAAICYTYLADVTEDEDTLDLSKSGQFYRSKWFTRGWTIQELLAPKQVIFLNATWTKIGTKESLQHHIQNITGIVDLKTYRGATIAQIFSWASKRHTTRVEDGAYSLMGLCGITMPLLYGEGPAAFYRLQTAILEESRDESIFAWEPPFVDGRYEATLLLASSLRQFERCGDIERARFQPARPPWRFSNHGFHFSVLVAFKQVLPEEIIIVPLNCRHKGGQGVIALACQSVGSRPRRIITEPLTWEQEADWKLKKELIFATHPLRTTREDLGQSGRLVARALDMLRDRIMRDWILRGGKINEQQLTVHQNLDVQPREEFAARINNIDKVKTAGLHSASTKQIDSHNFMLSGRYFIGRGIVHFNVRPINRPPRHLYLFLKFPEEKSVSIFVDYMEHSHQDEANRTDKEPGISSLFTRSEVDESYLDGVLVRAKCKLAKSSAIKIYVIVSTLKNE